MRRWTETLCCLTALACADCAGTIDDPASFEAYASQARDGGAQTPEIDAGEQTPAPDAGEQTPAPDAGEQTPEPDAGETGPIDPPDNQPIACDFKALIQDKCGSAKCHGGPSASSGLDLTSDGLRDRLGNRSGSGPCADNPMLDDDAPEQSTLYLVVTGNACGIRMPIGDTLKSAEQACILQWIAGP